MKKILTLIIAISVLFAFTSPVSAVTVTYKVKASVTYKIDKGDKIRLYVVNHKNDKSVKWSSSKPKVAIVSKSGLVTAKKGGTTKITAKIGKKKYTVRVEVWLGEDVVYEDDKAPEAPKDRFDLADFDFSNAKFEPVNKDN